MRYEDCDDEITIFSEEKYLKNVLKEIQFQLKDKVGFKYYLKNLELFK